MTGTPGDLLLGPGDITTPAAGTPGDFTPPGGLLLFRNRLFIFLQSQQDLVLKLEKPEGITEKEIKSAGGYQATNGSWVTDTKHFDNSSDNEVNKMSGYWGATKDPIKEAVKSVEGRNTALDPTAV